MMGLDLTQFAHYVVTPTLKWLDPHVRYSLAAERLLLGTAWHESNGLRYLDQVDPGPDDPGPAVGVYQMEPATHRDIWRNYLEYHDSLTAKIKLLRAPYPDPSAQLRTNLAYATAMARLQYYRHPAPLPELDDLDGLAAYAKRYFNTRKGKATVADYRKALAHVATTLG